MSVPRRASPTATLAALCLGGMSYAFMQSLVAPALPDIRDATHASANAVSWVLSGFLLSASIFTPIMGRLGVGPKEVVQAADGWLAADG